MSDRSVQDVVIRALADADFRKSKEWTSRKLADPKKLEKFARFLARHFFYERVVHFFKYSRALAPVLGRAPEEALTIEAFDVLLPSAVIGSRESAEDVAGLVGDYIAESPGSKKIPYLSDLTAYEKAMMVSESGPRDWTGESDAEAPEENSIAEVVEGTIVLELEHDLPAILPLILLKGWESPPMPERRKTRLLLARSKYGQVTVMSADDRVVSLMEATVDRRTLGEIAGAAGLSNEHAQEWMRALVDAGAVRFYPGS